MAQKFRKVDPRIWTDEGFAKLDTEGKVLAFWLLTSARVNRCGLVLWSAALASEETGIDRHRVEGVLDTVCDTVSWALDRPSRVVFLARWWRYNRPDNASALKGAMADLWDVPRNNLKPALQRAKGDIPTPLHGVYDTVLDTVYDTVSPQEKEQEKEQEQDTLPPAKAGKGEARKKTPRKDRPKAKREPDPLFDAVAEVTGSDPKAAGSFVAKIRHALAAAEPPYTPDEVREFGRRFAELCPWALKDGRTRPELVELQKHIGKVRLRIAPPDRGFQPPPDFDDQRFPRTEAS